MRKIIYQSAVFLVMFIAVFCAPNICSAQSVVGKWLRNMSHMFSIDSATGKKVFLSEEQQKKYDAATAENGYKEILELRSDNTFTSTVTAAGKQRVHSGKYSLSGKMLDMNIPLVNGQKTVISIISISGTTMIWNLTFMGKSLGVQYDKM